LNGDPPDGVNLSSSPGFFLDGDADGIPGGDFRLQFEVAPSDEVLGVRAALFRSTTNQGSGFSQYHPFTDVDGSGRIDVRDLLEVRRRVYRPPNLAAVPTLAGRATTSTFIALFGDRRITTSVTLATLLI
jgi:hypothetical protein